MFDDVFNSKPIAVQPPSDNTPAKPGNTPDGKTSVVPTTNTLVTTKPPNSTGKPSLRLSAGPAIGDTSKDKK